MDHKMHNCCAQIPSMVHESYKNVRKPQTEQTLALLRWHPLGKRIFDRQRYRHSPKRVSNDSIRIGLDPGTGFIEW